MPTNGDAKTYRSTTWVNIRIARQSPNAMMKTRRNRSKTDSITTSRRIFSASAPSGIAVRCGGGSGDASSGS